MLAWAGPTVTSSNAKATARDGDAVQGGRMRRGHARARARVNIGSSRENFNRVKHASIGRRYFVETPIAGLGEYPSVPPEGGRSTKVMEDLDAFTTSNTSSRGSCRGGDDARDGVPGLRRDITRLHPVLCHRRQPRVHDGA